MPKDSFQFKKFRIEQRDCPMKVGTDGTLLGAWAQSPNRKSSILDIGTGTGLIALMMAQRYPLSCVTALEIDSSSTVVAQDNVLRSPFADRISVVNADVNGYFHSKKFDAILSNPPFFFDSLKGDDERRNTARHTTTLTYDMLVASVCRLLADDGLFSLIIPSECLDKFQQSAFVYGLFETRRYLVRTVARKAPSRVLLEYRKHPTNMPEVAEVVLQDEGGVRSEWYAQLTSDFYIR